MTTGRGIADFLRARFAEDEAVARDERLNGDSFTRLRVVWDDIGSSRTGYHLAVSPARVLAECEAKRAIVKWCGEREQVWVGTLADDPESPRPEQFVQGPIKHPADAVVLRYLALPYADHPDFREEWRP